MSKFNLDNKKLLLIIFAIILVVIDVLIFVIEKTFNFGFWFAYVFFMISYIISVITVLTIFDKLNTVYIKYPLGYSSIIYVFVTMVVLILSMIFNISKKIALILNLIPFILFVVVYIISIIGIRTILNNKKDVAEKVDFLKSLSVKIENICNLIVDEIIKKELKKLSEDISYSDPMSTENVQSIETEIVAKVDEFENDLSIVKLESIEKLSNLLKNRNSIIKNSK